MKKKNEKISIAMATYNGADYLKEQLDSFLRQTRLPDEIVISDDNSTDDTLKILYEFKDKASFEVKIYQNVENLGYTKNFERALLKTNGDLIFMSDQDDVWFENKIEYMIQVAKNNPDRDLFVHDTKITNAALVSQDITKMQQIERIGESYKSMVMGACTVVKKGYLSRCLPIPQGFKGHDTWLHDIAPFLNRKRKVVKSILQLYRIHGLNTSSYVVNNPNKISYIDNILRRAKTFGSVKQRLQKSFKQKKVMFMWLSNQNKAVINNEKLVRLKNEIESIEKRAELYNLRKFKRLIPIMNFYVDGGYTSFSGWRSAVKDAIT